MKQLLDGRLSPLAHSWGFLEAPVDAVAAAMQTWATRIGFPLRSKEMAGDLQTILLHLEPLSTFPQREVVVSTQSAWTALFDNAASGGDPYTPVSYLAQEMECRGLTVASVPDTITKGDRPGRGTYGAVQLALYGPEGTEFLNHVRSIQAINDGGKWVFVVNGPIQPFERPEAYRARRIRDRFPPWLLEEYCLALGIRLFDADFYGPRAIVLESTRSPGFAVRTLGLNEAREELGLPPVQGGMPEEQSPNS